MLLRLRVRGTVSRASVTASSIAATITVCGVFQFSAVKVRLLRSVSQSVLVPKLMVTFAVGWLVSRTVKESSLPVSSTTVVPSV